MGVVALSQRSPAPGRLPGLGGVGRGQGCAHLSRAVLTCHSASPGGRSPAQSLFHQQWSGTAQSPGRKQQAGAEGEAQPQSRQTMCQPCYIQQGPARQGQSFSQQRLTPAPSTPALPEPSSSCSSSGLLPTQWDPHLCTPHKVQQLLFRRALRFLPPRAALEQLQCHLQGPVWHRKWNCMFSALSWVFNIPPSF